MKITQAMILWFSILCAGGSGTAVGKALETHSPQLWGVAVCVGLLSIIGAISQKN